MAKVPMTKLEIIALLSDAQRIVERLQRRGCVELENVSDPALVKLQTAGAVSIFEKNLETASAALKVLDHYGAPKKGLFASLYGRPAISTADFAEKKEETGRILDVCGRVLEADREIRELTAARGQNALRRDQLAPWRAFPFKGDLSGTGRTALLVGMLPREWEENALSEALSEAAGVPVAADAVSAGIKGRTAVALTVLKEDREKVEAVLREMDFAPVTLPKERNVTDEIARLAAEDREMQKGVDDREKELAGIAKDERQKVVFLEDFLRMRMDKYRALEKLACTDETMILRGFVPAKWAPALVREFEEKYGAAITLTEPAEEDDVPVLLENGKFSAPLESITEMYALPGKKDPDPSPIMAFAYYVLFGMMLSDAGYGLMMVLATVFVLHRFPLEEKMKNTMRLFRNCGISTLIWGALFGSWWGDLPQTIGKNFFGTGDFSTALWFEPIKDPIRLLLFCFGVGILHLFLGVGVKGHLLWKEGKKFDALCETVPLYLTILGVAPLGAGIFTPVPPILSRIGTPMMLTGVILLVLTAQRRGNIFSRLFGGLYALYNTATGWLGDILSYSRLLALGLATGSIAGVVNLICVMPDNAVVKAVLLVVAGSAVHVANLAINLLGAYVHSDRLQFVELFNKFYEGGGRAFAPLKADTKSFRFEKENIYHD
ncbi:MAG: V-type ATP synthase subunit I [Clostridia bacterium]|nr:V-type ATP synthase subunit I [Clostridia bacterium]